MLSQAPQPLQTIGLTPASIVKGKGKGKDQSGDKSKKSGERFALVRTTRKIKNRGCPEMPLNSGTMFHMPRMSNKVMSTSKCNVSNKLAHDSTSTPSTAGVRGVQRMSDFGPCRVNLSSFWSQEMST